MKSYLDLIPITAKVNKKRNRMTLICIVLAVFLVTGIFGMADMYIRCMRFQEIKKSGNWHVIFTDINKKNAAMIGTRPEVKASGWYLYAGKNKEFTISGKPVLAIGTNPDVFKNMFPTKVVDGVYPTKNNQIAITENAKSSLNVSLGDTITLEHSDSIPQKLTIVGFVSNTSKLLKQDDNAVFMTTEEFRSIVPNNLYTNQWVVQLSAYCNMQKVIADITTQFQLTNKQVIQNGNLLAALGQSKNNYVLQLYSVAGILFAIVLLAGILMITSSMNSNVMQRTEFFGMMRCLGATRKQIMRFVTNEGLRWCKTAIPLGVGMGIVIVWILSAILKFLIPDYFTEMPTFGISMISIVSGTFVGILTVLIASGSPAKKASRVSPLTAVSGNANSYIPVRTAAKTTFLSVDVALGIHHAKSSKKNFFLMVGSYALSIVLFLSFSSTIDFMHHAVNPLNPWTPDISIISSDNTCSINQDMMKELQDNPKVKRAYGRMFAYRIPVNVNGQDKAINLISYDDRQFHWAKKYLLHGSVDVVTQKDNQVLIEYNSEDSLHMGDTLMLNLGDKQKQMTVAGMLSSTPFDNTGSVRNVICNERTFRKLTGNTGYTIIDIQLTKHADDHDVNTIRKTFGSNIHFSDSRLSNRQAKGAYYSYGLFIYGFLMIITLISIFNIVNSMALSVSARIKQYGSMRAVGMSDHQLMKTVAAEAVTYAVSGILAGCVLGLPLHKLLFEKMVTSHWGDPWLFPFDKVGIIVTIILFASILAIHGPAKRIHHMSIVDTINAH